MLGKVDPTPLKPGMGKLLQVVPVRKSNKAPSVKLSCEGRILGRLEVLGKDGRHKGFGVEDHEGFSVGYPSYDVPVPFVGEDFHQLVAVVRWYRSQLRETPFSQSLMTVGSGAHSLLPMEDQP